MTAILYKWSLERYHAAIDAGVFDDQAVELLRGNIVVMAPEREPHACYSSLGAEYLRQLLGSRAAVRETKPVTLPNHSEPVPDVAIVQSPLERYLAHHPYPADIFWLCANPCAAALELERLVVSRIVQKRRELAQALAGNAVVVAVKAMGIAGEGI
ncbi:Uma2 family endonuclease [Nodosilinea nodulosa]|uniref:Uma2 family endonuclease n=1 Tax=Nodosilinea nodulosa TaxID=416001 RepID=UPI000A044F0E|nr:Uma2 family endonuclease [Nodosilinea nodulosa]